VPVKCFPEDRGYSTDLTPSFPAGATRIARGGATTARRPRSTCWSRDNQVRTEALAMATTITRQRPQHLRKFFVYTGGPTTSKVSGWGVFWGWKGDKVTVTNCGALSCRFQSGRTASQQFAVIHKLSRKRSRQRHFALKVKCKQIKIDNNENQPN